MTPARPNVSALVRNRRLQPVGNRSRQGPLLPDLRFFRFGSRPLGLVLVVVGVLDLVPGLRRTEG